MNRVAVNVCDLSEAFPFPGLGGMLLADFAGNDSPVVYPERGRVDSGAVVLDGPAASDGARLEALIDLLITVIGPRKVGSGKIRIWREGPKGGWSLVRRMK